MSIHKQEKARTKWNVTTSFGLPFTFEPKKGVKKTLVAFKTPLTKELPPAEVLDHYNATFGLTLQHVIDLTLVNGNDYYDEADFFPAKYRKEPFVGNKRIPSEAYRKNLCDFICQEKLGKNEAIGIHCSTVNRCGYIVIYLLMKRDWRKPTLPEAIQMFEEARQ